MSTDASRSRFLSKRLILAIHRDLIETFGGAHGIRDMGLLESALEQPISTFGGVPLHPSLTEQAAAYAFHLTSNHPFIDGNKRTAFAAMETFLRLNGMVLDMSDDEAVTLMVGVADGAVDKAALVAEIERRARPVTT